MEDHVNILTLDEFLESRGVSQETIQYFNEEKIDASILLDMPDEILKKYISKYGDRIALKTFCKRTMSTSKKSSLIEKLRSKMLHNEGKTQATPQKNKTIRRATRSIEIGWLCSNHQEGSLQQIRTKAGGGTRKVSLSRYAKCHDILDKAKELFFPDGFSSKGSIDQFQIELLDYKSHKLDLEMNIQQIYDISALSSLRFYLATTHKEEIKPKERQQESIPETITRNLMVTSQPNRPLGHTQAANAFSPDANFIQDFVSEENISLQETMPPVDILDLEHDYAENAPEYMYREEDVPNYLYSEEIFQDNFEDPLQNVMPVTMKDIKTLNVHRGKVFEEYLQAYENNFFYDDPKFKIVMILPNGDSEYGEDFGGVFRDTLSEFWGTFYDRCTVGTNLKVPYIRHDFGEVQWQGIAYIFTKGYEVEGYIPIKLAPIFIKCCFGQDLADDDIINNFYEYICESERDTIKMAFENFDEVNREDVLDVVTAYDSKWIPSENNIKQLVKDLAHKELIQKPAFVVKCFASKFKEKGITFFEIEPILKTLQPTAKNCLSKIDVKSDQVITPEKTKVFGYLKKYIKEVDEKMRSSFLRFCTGSDLPIVNISVLFTETSGLKRSLVAHTCVGLLELPCTYENFPTFRSEVNNLLSSNVWVMDII